jgi:hypothetical protein
LQDLQVGFLMLFVALDRLNHASVNVCAGHRDCGRMGEDGLPSIQRLHSSKRSGVVAVS